MTTSKQDIAIRVVNAPRLLNRANLDKIRMKIERLWKGRGGEEALARIFFLVQITNNDRTRSIE